jgi:multiple antibiotic resistance protein
MFGLSIADLNYFFSAIPFSYMALFPVVNPLGGAFVILALTAGTPADIYRQLCGKIAINTFFLLITIFFIGTYILEFFGISLPIVQLGGGIVVAFIGWRLLNQNTNTMSGALPTDPTTSKKILGLAFYPLTLPITAGPGCMAVALTISAHETINHELHTTLLEKAGAVIGILLIAISVYICYRYAAKITKRLGEKGTQVIIRLSAFIIFCIGLQISWHGVQGLYGSLV